MVNIYKITVQNDSGSQRKYALFNKAPQVTGSVQGEIWGNVFASKTVPPGDSVTFKITNKYYAFVGSSEGKPGDQVQISVGGSREVNLGSKKANGQLSPGTTLDMVVIDDAPQFTRDIPAPSAYADSFSIQTGDFDRKQAERGKYLIGLGGSSGGGLKGPVATFSPEPNTTYQIQPINTFYVSFGSYEEGSLIRVQAVGVKEEIDFTQRPDEVTIVHNTRNQLTTQED